jgi:alpha-L-fucosidase
MRTEANRTEWFVKARFGLFIHFGLYSMLARGEWVMNKERISREEYCKLADSFDPVNFDADQLCAVAKAAGMTYVVFTTMHHEGYRMYDSGLTDFCSTKTFCRRDFTSEIISAARKYGLKVGLYHTLNNWHDQPDAVDALEDKTKYLEFIEILFARIRELLTKYKPVDILWYDGWWPFNAEGWQAEKMNEMARSIQPHIIINGRNGLPGDFSTPEGHMSKPSPWNPWETCMTLNDSWGYHKGDNNWKSVRDIIKMLAQAANGRGNLLLNIGPMGDGSIPEVSLKILERLTAWMKINREALFNTDLFYCDPYRRSDGWSDFNPHGTLTASGNNLYLLATNWMGSKCVLNGLETPVRAVSILGSMQEYPFHWQDNLLTIDQLPETALDEDCTVIKIECVGMPKVYNCGGTRVPNVDHPRYDPCPSDINW